MSDNIIACICEGTAEQAIIDILLENEKLIFSKNDLLDERVIRTRNAKKFEDKYLGKAFSEKITIYRILDSVNEKFKLSKAYRNKVDVINIYTRPEIEILIIINESKYDEFSKKYKNKIKASEYCKTKLKLKDIKTRNFILNYFSDSDKLVHVIKEYQRVTKKTEHKSLADLLK